MKILLAAILIGNVTITSYRSVPRQTDGSPWITSIGERVHPHGIAVSRDLLSRYGGPLNYGDVVYIEGFGFKVVNDVMHERKKASIDIWVATYNEERRIGVRHGNLFLVSVKEELQCQKLTLRKSFIVTFVRRIQSILSKIQLRRA